MAVFRVTVYNAQGWEVDCRDFSERLDAENFAADATRRPDHIATVRRLCYDPASNPARLTA
jgi:hypothetical protein